MRFINPTDSMYAGICPAPTCPTCGGEGCCAPGQCIMGQNQMPYGVAPMPAANPVPAWARPTPVMHNPQPPISGCVQCGDIPCCPPNVCEPYYPPYTGEVFYHCKPPAPKVGSYAAPAGARPASSVMKALRQMPGASVVSGVTGHTMGAVRTLGSNPASVADRDEMCCVC